LLIQQSDGSGFFNRSWAEFKVGFGDPSGNYWLGNEWLRHLTKNYEYKLQFDLQSRNNKKWYYAEYSTFRVLPEAGNYRLQVSGYSGNASNSFEVWNSGMMFTTYDRDNDLWSGNCAVESGGGGFWYWNCGPCRVNGASRVGWFQWLHLPGGWDLQSSRMWLQCK